MQSGRRHGGKYSRLSVYSDGKRRTRRSPCCEGKQMSSAIGVGVEVDMIESHMTANTSGDGSSTSMDTLALPVMRPLLVFIALLVLLFEAVSCRCESAVFLMQCSDRESSVSEGLLLW